MLTLDETASRCMTRITRILLLEDSDADAELLGRELRKAGIEFEARCADTRESFTKALETFAPDLILADFSLPGFNGLHALKIARAHDPDLPFLLVSGSVGEETAIDIMRSGATDYVLKHRLTRLGPAVHRALAEAEERAQRRAAESALARRAAELERSNADLEQFAYICSHDLREPLRTISTFADLIQEQAEGKLDELCRGYFQRVVEGTERMRRMIDGLLEYSRANSETAPVTACDASRAFRAALEGLKTVVQHAGAVVTSAELPIVRAGEDQLVRVFQNLVTNAIKFNRSGAPTVHVQAQRSGEEWIFGVCDNGIGIAADARGRVFEMFRRLHNRTEYPGEGMGLAVCKKIIERYGGRIWIEANPGGGSIVHFTAPPEERAA